MNHGALNNEFEGTLCAGEAVLFMEERTSGEFVLATEEIDCTTYVTMVFIGWVLQCPLRDGKVLRWVFLCGGEDVLRDERGAFH